MTKFLDALEYLVLTFPYWFFTIATLAWCIVLFWTLAFITTSIYASQQCYAHYAANFAIGFDLQIFCVKGDAVIRLK